MEHLTKQQIVLLTLFVAFVTSIATGVVTVSLMDQDPGGVTQVINRVVERTVERAIEVPANTMPASVISAPLPTPNLTQVVENISKSVVKVRDRNTRNITGYGVIISKDGLVLTDKSALGLPTDDGQHTEYEAVLENGEVYTIKLVQAEIIGDTAFVLLIASVEKQFIPVVLSSSLSPIKLGETVYALGGKDSLLLKTGMIQKMTENPASIETTISSTDLFVGSPLFTNEGVVVGYKTDRLGDVPSFYPTRLLSAVIPRITR